MTITRRTALAVPLILPTVPSLATESRVAARDLAYLANNLRRADDMARRIHAPLDTAAAWGWIADHLHRADDLDTLDFLDRADLIADIEGLGWQERLALRHVA